jgi:hypothetical protein
MRWVIEQLHDGSPRPAAAIIKALAGRLDEDAVRLLIGMLVKHGLVEIRV